MLNWAGAVAYCRWLSEKSDRAWRLPGELEWEKAARGVDARRYPWGDWLDTAWCCMRDSHPDRPLPDVVDSYPVDESVYGVRGLGGGVQDWCGDLYNVQGAEVSESVVRPPGLPESVDMSATARRPVRGGFWFGFASDTACAYRDGHVPTRRYTDLGFRVVRSLART
jgi:formylglycine-generating enzyme required for sulfatase activity